MAVPNPVATYPKDPSEVLDYTIDWEPYLAGDAIASVVWTVAAGINQNASMYSRTTSTIWLGGGVAGTLYNITCQITTVGLRTADRTFRISVVLR